MDPFRFYKFNSLKDSDVFIKNYSGDKKAVSTDSFKIVAVPSLVI